MPSRLRLGGQQSERRVVIRGRYKSTDSVSSRDSSHPTGVSLWVAAGGGGRMGAGTVTCDGVE